MKKNLRIAGIAFVIVSAIIIWGYYDLKKDPSPLYIPGRDTIEEWNDGVCEIIGTSSHNELRFHNQCISRSDNFVKAYRKVDHQIYFIMTRGKIVVDLETATYKIYEDVESVYEKHNIVFNDQDSFIWLSGDE
ncbi:MAG: hypothetical protein IJ973_02070 [Christensenellaceae bacterium]|nr:hypothetical protein [Christensenellaceae bacterium]